MEFVKKDVYDNLLKSTKSLTIVIKFLIFLAMPKSPDLKPEQPQSEDQYPRIVHTIHDAIEKEFHGVISIGEVDRRFRELGKRSKIQDFVGIFVERGIRQDLRDGQETEIPYPQDQ